MSVNAVKEEPKVTHGDPGGGTAPIRGADVFEVPHGDRPEAGFAEGYPQMTLGIDGSISIKHAPDEATFSLAFLTSESLDENVVHREANLITFVPTEGKPVVYKVVGYDFDRRRFNALRVA